MVALITGAASDIGKSIAIMLNNNGYDLVLLYHNKEIDYLDELNNSKELKCDISNEEKVKRIINLFK